MSKAGLWQPLLQAPTRRMTSSKEQLLTRQQLDALRRHAQMADQVAAHFLRSVMRRLGFNTRRALIVRRRVDSRVAHQAHDLLSGEQLLARQQLNALRRHAVVAPQVAPLCQRNAQVGVHPPANMAPGLASQEC